MLTNRFVDRHDSIVLDELGVSIRVKGCLLMSLADYLRLLDWTGRQLRRDKRGAIPSDVAPILQRLKITDDGWRHLVQDFSRLFHRAAGTPTTLALEATRRGHRWLKGIGPSRAMFA